MNQAWQVISQLEQVSNQGDTLANEMTELLFGQMVMTLKRHRYATDDLPTRASETLPDKLITALAGSLERPITLDAFCDQKQFCTQTGITVNQHIRQIRVCYPQYLLQHNRLIISEISVQCSFEGSNYFSVVFTRETVMTPSQWRHHSIQNN